MTFVPLMNSVSYKDCLPLMDFWAFTSLNANLYSISMPTLPYSSQLKYQVHDKKLIQLKEQSFRISKAVVKIRFSQLNLFFHFLLVGNLTSDIIDHIFNFLNHFLRYSLFKCSSSCKTVYHVRHSTTQQQEKLLP